MKKSVKPVAVTLQLSEADLDLLHDAAATVDSYSAARAEHWEQASSYPSLSEDERADAKKRAMQHREKAEDFRLLVRRVTRAHIDSEAGRDRVEAQIRQREGVAA